MPRRIRAALWHNMVAPYSVPLFQWVTVNTDVDLEVLFGETSPKSRYWKVNFGSGYRYRVLPSFRIPRLDCPINPTLSHELERGKYDVIMATDANEIGTQIAYRTARRLGVPFALWTKELDFLDVDPYNCLRDWLMLLPRHFKSWVLSSSRRLSDRIKSESDAYLAFSEMAKEHIVSKGGKPGRIVQICNSIDMERFLARISESRQGDKLQDFRKQRGWEGKTVLLSLSYLLRRKGIHILLEAFSRLQVQDTVLAIVGDGPFRATLQETARRLGLQNVEFHPYTHDSHLYYLSSDALILPTLGPEPWGLTVNEALLCGIPAIVTTNVGAREIIPHHELVVAPGDSEALCRAMQFIISDVALRESYRKLGPKIVHEECSVEQAGRGLAEAFRLAVESSC